MSNRAISAVIDYGQLKGPHLALMLVIADGMDKDTDQYHAKIATLSRQAHCSERAVQRSILTCIRAGELVVQEGKIYPNTFYIPIYEGEPGYHPMPCDDPTHTCTKYHTPLTVSREEARAEDVKKARAAARRAYPRRGDGSVTRPGGARGDGGVTPRVTEVSPPGDGSVAPPVTEVAPFTPSVPPSSSPDAVPGASTDSFFEMSSAWRQIVGSLTISAERQEKLLRRCRLERHAEDARAYRLVCADSAAQEFASRMFPELKVGLRALHTTARDATLEVTR